MPVVLLRKQINTLPEAREEISRLRQQLQRTKAALSNPNPNAASMTSLNYTYHIITKNPEYAQQLMQLADTIGEPIKSHIHTIITNARKAYGH